MKHRVTLTASPLIEIQLLRQEGSLINMTDKMWMFGNNGIDSQIVLYNCEEVFPNSSRLTMFHTKVHKL